MKEERNNGKGIFYGVIGVATLIVAIIGATFAYFTASQSNTNAIGGNAATISFGLTVNKVTNIDETMNGMIPMTDGMVKAAVTASTPCEDNNGNAVCQIYKITVTNSGSASIFLDGYVNLEGGSPNGSATTPTNMRWAQVFATQDATSSDVYTYDITGSHVLAYVNGSTSDVTNGTANLNFGGTASNVAVASGTSNVSLNETQATANYTYGGNSYLYISNNYMRTSGHTFAAEGAESFDRTNDASSALVYSQYLEPTGNSGSSTDLYIVVWLTETGTDQTMGSPTSTDFFSGKVNFLSATGGEVSATFSGYTRNPRTA